MAGRNTLIYVTFAALISFAAVVLSESAENDIADANNEVAGKKLIFALLSPSSLLREFYVLSYSLRSMFYSTSIS